MLPALLIISLLGNAFPFIDFKVRVTRCRFRFNNEWYGVMQGARFTHIIERGFHHLFLPELFLSFPPSERGKLIPHSHSPNRAERHSAIILQLVPPIVLVSNTHKSIGFVVLTTVVKDQKLETSFFSFFFFLPSLFFALQYRTEDEGEGSSSGPQG